MCYDEIKIIENLEFYPEATVEGYNRWGQLLYEGGPGTDPWDGTYNGKPVPTGSYVYVIRPFRGVEDITGIVTVVR
jgi:gliding motility-associated-like protein